MTCNINYKKMYYDGIQSFKNGDLLSAIKNFQILINNFSIYRENATLMLVKIYIKNGNYKKARELLGILPKDNCSYHYNLLYGLLENIENNYERSLDYYSNCLNSSKKQIMALLTISKIYIQMGDYEIARKMLLTIQQDKIINLQATIGLICLDILLKKYNEAYRLLLKIDRRKLTMKYEQHYHILKSYIEYMLGYENLVLKSKFINRLFSTDDENLIEHLKLHTNKNDRYTKGCFFEKIDFVKLLSLVRDRISSLNPNHFEISDMYRFRLDEPIGYKGDELTNDICVTTMLNTKNIFTIYPVKLSSEFDVEGMSVSKDLIIKRKGE